MPDCCATTTPQQSKREFLEAKLSNFRSFITPHCATPDSQALLARYTTLESVLPLVALGLPLWKAGRLEDAVDTVADQLGAQRMVGADRDKLLRYLTMFCEVISS